MSFSEDFEKRPETIALRKFQRADEKYRRGDGITDEELAILIPRYKNASAALDAICHPDHRLAAIDLRRRYDELVGFRESRKRAGFRA